MDLATHEGADAYGRLEDHVGEDFVTVGDWSEVEVPADFDLVVANDLFPNVDNRLYEFVDWGLERAPELRLVLTYYEDTVFRVERTSTGEILTVQPWSLRELRHFLEDLERDRPQLVGDVDWSQIRYEDHSGELFGNRRNIVVARLREPPTE